MALLALKWLFLPLLVSLISISTILTSFSSLKYSSSVLEVRDGLILQTLLSHISAFITQFSLKYTKPVRLRKIVPKTINTPLCYSHICVSTTHNENKYVFTCLPLKWCWNQCCLGNLTPSSENLF